MRRFAIECLCVALIVIGASAHAAETVTVGGARVTIPDGWARADAEGQVVLVPKDLPQGVACSLILLGGDAFDGSVMDRLAADWKELASGGKMVWEDKAKLDGAGNPMEIATRAGTLEVSGGVQVHVWMVILHPKGRVERMILTATTREAFAKYVPAVAGLIQGAKLVPVVEGAAAKAEVPPVPAAGAAAAAGNFGHMRYSVPAGWTEKRYANGVIIALEKPPADEQLEIQLMSPVPASGTLPQAMEAAWDDVCKQTGLAKTNTVNNTAYSAEAARRSFKGWEYVRATGTVTANANRNPYYMELFVIKVAERYERLVVLSVMHNHNVSRYSLYDSPVHRRTVQEFVFALKFDDWTDAVVEPASLKGDGIIGVWQGISMFGGTFKAAYAIFYSNGQVYLGSRFPTSGCDRQNTWLEAELIPRYWGTYTFQDGAGVIKMPYGEVPVRSKGNGLTITTSKTDHAFARVPSVDGARFDGTYVMAEAYEKIPVITFTADGHFTDQGAMKVLDHEVTNEFAITQAPGAGTYSVEDHTITFRYEDGRVHLLAYPGTDYDGANRSPPVLTLGFNEDPLKRK
jgi:hypothetical protein